MALIELSPVESDKDKEELLSLIKAHHKYTSSSVASMMIADWDRYVSQFIKVIPVEYSRLAL
jgi:glutamate synthase (NADPH/NADH) large chain